MTGIGQSGHDEGRRYVLHVVAELAGLPPRTVSRIVRLGLLGDEIGRRRGRGTRRLFSDADLERLRLIRRLVDDLGVNLAGAEVILNLREQVFALRVELEQVRRELDAHRRP